MLRSLASLSLLKFTLATFPCYYPNGDLAHDQPCNLTAPVSTCCGPTYACLSNNICVTTALTNMTGGSTTYVRGSCTDSTWQSPACPQFCIDPDFDDTAGGEGIAKCPNTDLDEYYCIDGSSSNCTTHQNVLLFSGAPTYVFNPVITSTASLFSATPKSSLSAPSTSTTAMPTTTSSSKSSGSSYATPIGVAIGVAFGLIALALGTYFVFRHKRKTRKRSDAVSEQLVDEPRAGKRQEHEQQYSLRTFPRHEADSQAPKYELWSGSETHELAIDP